MRLTAMLAALFVAPTVAFGQSDVLRGCSMPGAADHRPACMASVFLNHTAGVLEVLRQPEPQLGDETSAGLQAVVAEFLFRLRDKQRRYREACEAIHEAVRGAADSSATVSADLLCEAFAVATAVDSSLAEKIKADLGRTRERSGAEIAEAAEEDAKARERMYAASRIMALAVSSLTYPLIESASGEKMRLAMTEPERRALLRQMDSIYPASGPERKQAEHVLEQSIDLLRKFLLQDWSVRGR